MSRREQNRQAQRERILDAARWLFSSRGFDQATMANVAQVAGVARATVFNYFASKHALVEAVTEDVFAYYRGMLDAALSDERSSTASLVRALFSQMGAGIEQYHGFYRGVFREIVKIQVGLDEGGAAGRTRQLALERLERLLARGIERGDLHSVGSAEDLALGFDSLANGTINHWLYDDASGSLRERMERAAEIFLAPVAVGLQPASEDAPPALAPELPTPTRQLVDQHHTPADAPA